MMNFINIDVNQKDLRRIDRALTRMEVDAKLQAKQLPYLCALDYKNLVVANILSQKYAATYPRYNDRYAAWKVQEMLRGSHYWRLYGDLLNAMTVFKVGDGQMGGIPATAMDSGGKSWFGTRSNPKGKPKPIAMYGREVEKKRPVFGPTTDEYAREGFLRRGREALRHIGKDWR